MTGETDETLMRGVKLLVRVQRVQYGHDGQLMGVAVRLETDVPGFIPVCFDSSCCLGLVFYLSPPPSPTHIKREKINEKEGTERERNQSLQCFASL